MTLGVLDLLGLRGFDATLPTKMLRHQSARYPVQEMLQRGWLDAYQSYQGRPILHRVEQVISFYGLDGRRACLYGVFAKKGVRPSQKGDLPPGCEWAEAWQRDAKHFYELERVHGFEDLEDRLIVDWGRGALAWHQRLSNKAVLEIRPKGRRLPPFEDYLEFMLTYDELQELFTDEDAHREWRARLEAVGGVYLILAETTGDLYVGSAYGAGGIWARWREYARTGHGGNLLLKERAARDRDYPRAFCFSVLQILLKTLSRDEVIGRESLLKQKLGSRARGLNLN